MVIKGEAGDEACLCTPTHTYLMRLAESSNTHYLLPGSLACGEPLGAVAASVNTYYELKPTVPRLLKLRSLLSKRTYEGFDEAREEGAAEAEPPAKRLTTSSLRAAVQCSDAQLGDALDAMHAVQLEGEWRLLGSKYRHQITEYILTLVDQNDWPRGSVSVREVLRQSAADFPDFAPQAVRHCLRHLSGQPRPRGLEPDAADAELTAALDERKVSLFYAEAMLAERERWRKDDFLVGWRAVAPDGVELDLLMLRVRARARAPAFYHGLLELERVSHPLAPRRPPPAPARHRGWPWRSRWARRGTSSGCPRAGASPPGSRSASRACSRSSRRGGWRRSGSTSTTCSSRRSATPRSRS